jgi:O-antigen/teichoic acid export membrane protein
MGYQGQIVNAVNGIDRPDLSFRINAVFVATNLLSNIVLVYYYGWIGAAIATAFSVAVSFMLAYRIMAKIIDFDLPLTEIGKQWLASVLMAVFVYTGNYIENTFSIVQHNFATVLLLVCFGALVYFLSLLNISDEFRQTINQNLR